MYVYGIHFRTFWTDSHLQCLNDLQSSNPIHHHSPKNLWSSHLRPFLNYHHHTDPHRMWTVKWYHYPAASYQRHISAAKCSDREFSTTHNFTANILVEISSFAKYIIIINWINWSKEHSHKWGQTILVTFTFNLYPVWLVTSYLFIVFIYNYQCENFLTNKHTASVHIQNTILGPAWEILTLCESLSATTQFQSGKLFWTYYFMHLASGVSLQKIHVVTRFEDC